MTQVTSKLGAGMTFTPLEATINYVASKYRPYIEALDAQLNSEYGLLFIPSAPLTEEQCEKLLFGRLFVGVDKPLKDMPSENRPEGPYSMVLRRRIATGYDFTTIQTRPELSPMRSAQTDFGVVRFGFIRHHVRSITRRWFLNDRARPNLFPGSPVAFLLCAYDVF
ncbi:MAG: hypothetical protein PHH11_11585 [Methylomonas sp.]|nr:hypothetical protein [Methylomonas sp.]